MLSVFLFCFSTPAFSQTEDSVADHICTVAWPVSCEEGAGGSTTCGGWSVLKDLAESETLPGFEGTCSTGTRITLGNAERTQGQPVGAMFPGTVVFAQAGRARDGRDYGGVVVVKLDLDDGSPQCYLRYMFLDRRDLVQVGEEVKAGQRLGSIASDDMSATNEWWNTNWPGQQPQVKIDIGCDDALVNLPHFMPRQPYGDWGSTEVESPHTCSLTKARFPARVLEYLLTYEDGPNTACNVGIRRDARYAAKPAQPQDDTEKELAVDNNYVSGAKPMNIIRRKETPVFAVFGHPNLKQTLFSANRNRSGANTIFRSHKNYSHATGLRCINLERLFNGVGGESITPEQAREYLTHCTNQHILTRGMLAKVSEMKQGNLINTETSQLPLRENLRFSPIPQHMLPFLTPEEQQEYSDRVNSGASRSDILNSMLPTVRKVAWRDQCQPLKMVNVLEEDYKVTDLLHKSWEEMLIEWPEARGLEEVDREPMQTIRLNEYTKYPYERINDPSHPFSPRHIFRETERERYSNYGVQCAATPVDIILGAYGEGGDRKIFGDRAMSFHQCISCRIDLNENHQACFADPYSYTNPGGCFGPGTGYGSPSGDGLCSEFYDLGGNPIPGFLDHLNELEDRYGLARGMLHATATVESSCRACPSPSDNCSTGNAYNAKGMFQMVYPGSWGVSDPYDPFDAAEGAARYHATYAQRESCDLPGTICAYNCGPGCGNCGNTETSNYVTKFSGFGLSTACSPSGPHPSGTGSSTGGGISTGGGSSGGGSSSPFGSADDVFGSGGAPGGAGTFDPAGCPDGYTGNSNSFSVLVTGGSSGGSGDDGEGSGIPSGSSTSKTCAPYSYPTPDMPGPGTYGCHGRNFYPPGCDAACKSRFNQKCDALRNYLARGGSSSSVCSNSSCPPRIHEGMDIAFEYGVPIYSAADGVVTRISNNGYVTIDHSGHCIDPDCTKRFGSGVDTRYYHLGRERVMVTEGQEVQRCTQVGTVGDARTEGVPHLHWETHNPNSVMAEGISTSHWGLAQDDYYHAHLDDKSCTGGVWDATGVLGGAAGICRVALPVDIYKPNVTPPELKDDLPPPEYLTDYQMSPLAGDVAQPSPPSEGLGDPIRRPFSHEIKGMIFNGVWTECDALSGADRTLCEDLSEMSEAPPEEDAESATPSSEGYIRPVPCTADNGSFGWRDPIMSLCNAGINPARYCNRHLHAGEDYGAPTGTPIFAAASGVVSGYSGSGISVEINHENGHKTRYMHMSQRCPEASIGSEVQQGQVIGFVGNTGNSSGPHLHFEIRTPEAIDPVQNHPAQLTDAGQCSIINSAQCGDVLDDLPAGAGVSGATGKTICIDKPCSVKYDEADTVSHCAFPNDKGGCGPLGHYSQRAEGNGGDCCYNITKPVASLNVLKVRPGFNQEAQTPFWSGSGRSPTFPRETESREVEHPILDYLEQRGEANRQWIEGAWDGERLAEEGGTADYATDNRGAPEAYTFYEHFRNHRPYIRWWDTGAESGNLYRGHANAESLQGQWDTLVGVGVEKQQCGYGGWGEPLNMSQRRCTWKEGCFLGNVPGQENPDALDGNTSWLELKLYQARSTYQDSLHCIPRYEKVYKNKSAEDFVLYMAGGTFSTLHHGLSAAGLIDFGWNLGWRGYASEKEGYQRFPWFEDIGQYRDGAIAGMVGGGLDRALPGDIIIWDQEVTGDNRLPHVAFITRAYNDVIQEAIGEAYELSKKRFFPTGPKPTPVPSVTVTDYNFGKYPDTCGITNWAAVAPDRTIYKDTVPSDISERMSEMGVNIQTCSNPDITSCYEPYWDNIKIYRPWRHVRE